MEKPLLGQTTQVNFRQAVAALAGGKWGQNCPWDAVITSVTMHFPPGCNALVDVAAGHSSTQIAPGDGYIALDEATPVIPMYEVVNIGEQLWVEIRNGDAVNPHTISVIVTLQRRQ